jgi:hypothetical protein
LLISLEKFWKRRKEKGSSNFEIPGILSVFSQYRFFFRKSLTDPRKISIVQKLEIKFVLSTTNFEEINEYSAARGPPQLDGDTGGAALADVWQDLKSEELLSWFRLT